VLLRVQWQSFSPQDPNGIFTDWWLRARKSLGKNDRRCFDSLVVLTFWTVWKERNRRTFDHVHHSVNEIVNLIIDEAMAWTFAGFKPLEIFVAMCGRSVGHTINNV
jgi:hypothetical protein